MNIEYEGVATRYPTPTCEQLKGEFFNTFDYFYTEFEHLPVKYPYPPEQIVPLKPLPSIDQTHFSAAHYSWSESYEYWKLFKKK